MDDYLDKEREILLRALSNIAQSMEDDYIEKNASFRAEAGQEQKIIRKSSGNCCEWCNEVAGVYKYPDVPKDVYRRHDNCDCTVEYVSGGKRQNVHTKDKYEYDRLDYMKSVGIKADDNPYFRDILKECIRKAEPSKYKVEKSLTIIKEGIEYSVDGINVILDPSPREEEIADIINRTLGKRIKIMPRFSGELRNMRSSDYLIDGINWDLKEGKDAVRDAIKRCKEQVSNFVIDITESKHDPEQLNRQIENIFKAYNTKFVESLIIIKDDKIIRVLKRKKSARPSQVEKVQRFK